MRWALNFRGQRQAIGRRWIFAALARVTPVIAMDTDGLRLYLSTADQGVSSSIFASGIYERELFARVTEELDRQGLPCGLRGRTFLDIGANIGSATCLALTAYGAANAWAFEPAPQNLQLLWQNVITNGLEDRVNIEPYALSDKDGMVGFEFSETNWGDHRVRVHDKSRSSPGGVESTRTAVNVPARSFDGLVAGGDLDLDSVGLAWVDVQGHEAHVLSGATALLDSVIPIVCEYWPYGLDRAGGLDRFNELIAGRRSRFVDLDAPGATARSTTELSTVAPRYQGNRFTNLLILQ